MHTDRASPIYLSLKIVEGLVSRSRFAIAFPCGAKFVEQRNIEAQKKARERIVYFRQRAYEKTVIARLLQSYCKIIDC